MPWTNNEKTKPIMKNRINVLRLNNGVIAKKKATSPNPIMLSTGFANDLYFSEKYAVSPMILTNTKLAL